MKTLINKAHVEGIVYEHNLQAKVTGPSAKTPNTPYIMGEVKILTDEENNNIVPVHFTYVTATTKAGKENKTYTVLKKIIDGELPTVIGGGKTLVKIDGEVALNDFYRKGDDNEPTLVSAKRIEGKFVHQTTDIDKDVKKRNNCEVDMIITGMRNMEATDDKPERNFIKGAIFNSYFKTILPIEFEVENPQAVAYFESLGASSSEPVFTKIVVRLISQTVSKQFVEESAFGEDIVKETTRETKKWLVVSAQKEPYAFDDESTITGDELKKAMADREVVLAEAKQRYLDSQAAKATPATTTNKSEKFDF